ncbi:hypothetical protein AAMO2058_001260400 [Amorphochlora amoebiformis]
MMFEAGEISQEKYGCRKNSSDFFGGKKHQPRRRSLTHMAALRPALIRAVEFARRDSGKIPRTKHAKHLSLLGHAMNADSDSEAESGPACLTLNVDIDVARPYQYDRSKTDGEFQGNGRGFAGLHAKAKPTGSHRKGLQQASGIGLESKKNRHGTSGSKRVIQAQPSSDFVSKVGGGRNGVQGGLPPSKKRRVDGRIESLLSGRIHKECTTPEDQTKTMFQDHRADHELAPELYNIVPFNWVTQQELDRIQTLAAAAKSSKTSGSLASETSATALEESRKGVWNSHHRRSTRVSRSRSRNRYDPEPHAQAQDQAQAQAQAQTQTQVSDSGPSRLRLERMSRKESASRSGSGGGSTLDSRSGSCGRSASGPSLLERGSKSGPGSRATVSSMVSRLRSKTRSTSSSRFQDSQKASQKTSHRTSHRGSQGPNSVVTLVAAELPSLSGAQVSASGPSAKARKRISDSRSFLYTVDMPVKKRQELRRLNKRKIHKCTQCPKRFSHKGSLTAHLRIHSGIKPHKCPHCSKEFTQRGNLTTHIRTHTKEKPFRCEHCDKAFSHKSNLNTHMQIHTGARPYKCIECGKGFARKSRVLSHLETHAKH